MIIPLQTIHLLVIYIEQGNKKNNNKIKKFFKTDSSKSRNIDSKFKLTNKLKRDPLSDIHIYKEDSNKKCYKSDPPKVVEQTKIYIYIYPNTGRGYGKCNYFPITIHYYAIDIDDVP